MTERIDITTLTTKELQELSDKLEDNGIEKNGLHYTVVNLHVSRTDNTGFLEFSLNLLR